MQLILYTADCVGNAKNCKYPRKAVVTSADELQDAVSTDHVCAHYRETIEVLIISFLLM